MRVLPCVFMSAGHDGNAQLQCAIYVRISEDRAGAGLGVARQEQDCRELAERRGWVVHDVYVDNDTEAFSGKPRKQWLRLVEDVHAGRVQAIVCWHPDRLTRTPRENEDVIDLADRYQVRLGNVTGEIDLSTPAGRLIFRQFGAYARYESEHKSERQKRANKQIAERGELHAGGRRCYGYTRNGDIIEEEAEHLREALRRLLTGESLRSVIRDFTDRGIRTTNGKTWGPVTLKRILTNPRLVGKRVHKGSVVADGNWEPILDEGDQQRLTAMLNSPSRRTSMRNTRVRRYLLTGGLIRCGLCGEPLQAQPSNSGRPGYVCRPDATGKGCGRIRIAAEGIDQDVAERVLGRLASPTVRRRLTAQVQVSPESGALLTDQLGDLEQRLVQLGEDYAEGLIGRTEFHAARNRVQMRIDETRQAVARAAEVESLPSAGSATELAAWWENASLERRHDLIATLIDHISIGSTRRRGFNGYDPDRVTFIWR